MSKSSVLYDAEYSTVFEKQIHNLERKDKIRAKNIRKEIEDIRADPFRKIDFGKGHYRVKRKRRVGDDRIIFVVCKQCRQLGHTAINGCPKCSGIKDETVVFAEIIDGHKYRDF
ncbi:hypothetical protein MUP05_06800 [Candidatus Bathyarchaeota archaeon]|nr:hypothetical protein [Candidatus Bathyarchaeota archaeon]